MRGVFLVVGILGVLAFDAPAALAVNPDDWDGDGVVNASDACPVFYHPGGCRPGTIPRPRNLTPESSFEGPITQWGGGEGVLTSSPIRGAVHGTSAAVIETSTWLALDQYGDSEPDPVTTDVYAASTWVRGSPGTDDELMQIVIQGFPGGQQERVVKRVPLTEEWQHVQVSYGPSSSVESIDTYLYKAVENSDEETIAVDSFTLTHAAGDGDGDGVVDPQNPASPVAGEDACPEVKGTQANGCPGGASVRQGGGRGPTE